MNNDDLNLYKRIKSYDSKTRVFYVPQEKEYNQNKNTQQIIDNKRKMKRGGPKKTW